MSITSWQPWAIMKQIMKIISTYIIPLNLLYYESITHRSKNGIKETQTSITMG